MTADQTRRCEPPGSCKETELGAYCEVGARTILFDVVMGDYSLSSTTPNLKPLFAFHILLMPAIQCSQVCHLTTLARLT